MEGKLLLVLGTIALFLVGGDGGCWVCTEEDEFCNSVEGMKLENKSSEGSVDVECAMIVRWPTAKIFRGRKPDDDPTSCDVDVFVTGDGENDVIIDDDFILNQRKYRKIRGQNKKTKRGSISPEPECPKCPELPVNPVDPNPEQEEPDPRDTGPEMPPEVPGTAPGSSGATPKEADREGGGDVLLKVTVVVLAIIVLIMAVAVVYLLPHRNRKYVGVFPTSESENALM